MSSPTLKLAVLLLLLLSVPIAHALSLPGSVAATEVQVIPPDRNFEQKLQAALKAYAQSRRDQKADDPRRHRAELTIIRKLLRSEGYYQGTVLPALDHYQVELGPRVHILQWRIEPAALRDESWPAVALSAGQPLIASDVLAAEGKLLAAARQACFPQARVSYQATVDEVQHTAVVVFTVDSGPRAYIDRIDLVGAEQVSERFLRNSMGLKDGQCLRRASLDNARLKLLQTGLVGSVSYELEWPEASAEDAAKTLQIPVRFAVAERKDRSIKASIGYTTDAKEGATLGWEHRNLFGNAEKLEIEGGIDQISHSAQARYTLPQFYHPDQELQFTADIDTEEPDAYTSRTRELAAILSRQWSGGRRGSIGVAYTESRVEQGGEGDTFSLISLPVALSLDRRDDAVDPHSGWYTSLALRPFTDINQENLDFLQTVLSLRTYISAPQRQWTPTLALRLTAGSMTGSPLLSIPADQRFYVGGGGSVRGYPYQTVGELSNGQAVGGKSFAETSVELRLHFANDFGLVVFADGGYAYPEEMPGFAEDFLWGAGVGLRYFTRFAPIRADIAMPLNQRDHIDGDFQLYISFGQAF